MRNSEIVMWFGRYKGRSILWLIENQPDYALWAHKAVARFYLTAAEIDDCLARTRGPFRSPY